eukprot:CAMPEP_0115190502 /NCGR_PEP_ID=MMETSP0270-20121206/12058_1 /TAXON_ID=71861 /ORGANISM="Scrippsiella trochoidea, Strain CCMP3099" /LENGTH=180 /DNA_ID=CAMNT_0002603715 /DNA_START=383 /DNA_END=924 /DNA_ORIENTATION=-
MTRGDRFQGAPHAGGNPAPGCGANVAARQSRSLEGQITAQQPDRNIHQKLPERMDIQPNPISHLLLEPLSRWILLVAVSVPSVILRGYQAHAGLALTDDCKECAETNCPPLLESGLAVAVLPAGPPISESASNVEGTSQESLKYSWELSDAAMLRARGRLRLPNVSDTRRSNDPQNGASM